MDVRKLFVQEGRDGQWRVRERDEHIAEPSFSEQGAVAKALEAVSFSGEWEIAVFNLCGIDLASYKSSSYLKRQQPRAFHQRSIHQGLSPVL